MDVICDLVLLSWNHLEETKPCLESLFERTTVPSRLFIIDNGSEPGVREFLRTVKPAGAIREVTFLQNETNEGFPRGMNRGIRASSSPYVCLLNNDLRFSRGWLQEMVAVAGANPAIGVVNPASSTFGDHPPRGMSLQAYADSRHQASAGQYVEVGMCIGFCMLITRPALDKLIGLSEEVERIFFEDEDFCMRAQQAGFRCVVADGAYVYHAEHKTVRKMPEREALFARNRHWCEERWGRRLRIAWPRFTPAAPGSRELHEWLIRLIGWARRRNLIYVYSPLPPGISSRELFQSVGLIPHADIMWHRVPSAAATLASAGCILKRRKKPFDLIAAPSVGWGRSLERLRWWHHADVVLQTDETRLETLWKRKSRSPSSS